MWRRLATVERADLVRDRHGPASLFAGDDIASQLSMVDREQGGMSYRGARPLG
jgi:hypothetical protein